MTLNGIFDLNRKTKNVVTAAVILAVAGLLSRLLGFLRNALLAYFFGAGDILDAYFLAFRLPDFFLNLMLFGAFTVGFVPVFIKLKHKHEKEAWNLTNDIFNLTLLVFSVLGLVFFIAAPWILKLIAPGFGPEKMALAITLSRIMFLQPIFLGLSTVFSGILQAGHKFLSYALAPIFYNLGIIFGILVLARNFGPVGLAWGVVIGAILHMLIQYPAARASGFKYHPIFSLKQEGLKRIFHIVVPRSASLILSQLNLIIMAALASFLGSGRVAVFNFATDLNSLILGVVAIPLGVAVFPVLAQTVDKGKLIEFGQILSKTFRQILFAMVPAAILFFILRAQIVRLTLGYGHFDWEDTILTIETVSLFLIGLVFQGILAIILRGFFALEDTKTPFWILLIGILVSLSLSLILAPVLDVSALALASSLGAIFNALALAFILSKKIKTLRLQKLIKPASIFVFSALLAGAGAYLTLYLSAQFLNTHKVLHLIIQSASAGLVGLMLYVLLNFIFKTDEGKFLRQKLVFGKSSVLPDELDESMRQM